MEMNKTMMMNYHTTPTTNTQDQLLLHLPTGFRFHPTDEELIAYYLVNKVLHPNFTATPITAQVDLNKCEPWDLPEKAKMIMAGKEKEWYFFSLRDRKYPTGLRTNRATEAGYWKATGKDREIHTTSTKSINASSSNLVVAGMKKTLVFYRGRAPTGLKTNWVMHEYRLEPKFAHHLSTPISKLDEWVISRVFQKSGGSGSGSGGAGPVTGGDGGKKNNNLKRLMINPCPNLKASDIIINSPSASDLPGLVDGSSNKNYKCSKDQHVPCFSTVSTGSNVFNPIHNNAASAAPFTYFPPPQSRVNNVIINAVANNSAPPNYPMPPAAMIETMNNPMPFLNEMNGGGGYGPVVAEKFDWMWSF